MFHTNPRFYKVEGLSKESKQGVKPHQHVVHRQLKSKKVFEEILWRSSGLDGLASKKVETDRKMRRERLHRLSTMAKNKRKPPQRVKLASMPSKPTKLRDLTPEEEEDELDQPLRQLIGVCASSSISDPTSSGDDTYNDKNDNDDEEEEEEEEEETAL